MKYLYKRLFLSALVISLMSIFFFGTAFAVTSIAKGYISTDTNLKAGMAVALSSDSNSAQQSVERASTTNKSKYLGVATKIDDSVVTISNKGATVYITNNGQHTVYSSNVNGDIKKGDILVLSPLKGVLMKSSDLNKSDTSVAVALEDFDAQKASSQLVDTDGGTKRSVLVGQINAEINTGTIINDQSTQSAVSVFGESLTGRPVSEIRIVMACIILLIILIVEGSIIYGAVSSSITALGRNPLSKKSVYKQLVHTSILALAILIVGAIGVYVVIWT